MRQSRRSILRAGGLIGLAGLLPGSPRALPVAWMAQADLLLGWRANTYFDLDRDQRRDFSARLDKLLVWHRSEQLPEYASFLTAAIDKAQRSRFVRCHDNAGVFG